MFRIIQIVPLFGVLFAFYWFTVKMGFFPHNLNLILFNLRLPSNAIWQPTWGDMMVLLGIAVLFVELFKSTRTSEASIIDHLLSTFVLIAYLTAWLIYDWAGNSVFLILASMSFLDVIAGFTITISAARRDLSIGGKI